MTAVVEVGLVSEGRAEIPEAFGVCVGINIGSGAQNCKPHLQGTPVLLPSASGAIRRGSDRL